MGASEHKTTELLGINNWQWNITDPYPNVKDVNSAKIISYDRTFYIFGGYVNNEVTNDILRFENGTWSRVGKLTSKRIKFSVILNVDKVYVIGGQKNEKFELCTLSTTVNCEQDAGIDFQGTKEPVLFGVSKDGPCDLKISKFKSTETKELMVLSKAKFKEVENFLPVQKTNYRKDKYIF